MNRIITHPGAAHRDELLAIGTLLAHNGAVVPVFRREPSEAELADPLVAVIDCGGRHDPGLLNFDHHQCQGGDCSFRLVMKYLGLHDCASEVLSWYDISNDFDVLGPNAALKKAGVSREAAALRSPLEGCLLRLFGKMTEVEQWFLELLLVAGIEIIDATDAMNNRIGELEKEALVVTVAGIRGIVSPIEMDPSFGLAVFRSRHCPDAAFSVCPDDRGAGHVLYRFDDDERIDFSALAGDARIAFAHKGGFVAKTRQRESLDSLLELVAKAAFAGFLAGR